MVETNPQVFRFFSSSMSATRRASFTDSIYHSEDSKMPLYILANTDKTLEQIIMDRVAEINSNTQYTRHKNVVLSGFGPKSS